MTLTEKNTEQRTGKLVVFEDTQIRRTFHNGEWYFSVIDVIRILAATSNPRRYWPELKRQLIENEGFVQLLGKIEQLKLESSDGKKCPCSKGSHFGYEHRGCSCSSRRSFLLSNEYGSSVCSGKHSDYPNRPCSQ